MGRLSPGMRDGSLCEECRSRHYGQLLSMGPQSDRAAVYGSWCLYDKDFGPWIPKGLVDHEQGIKHKSLETPTTW
jgi:hypothetical protein